MKTPNQNQNSNPESVDHKLKRLQNFAHSAHLVAEEAVPAIRSILDGKVQLPDNCPSTEVMALMELRHVEKKLTELTAAVAAVRESLSGK